MRVLGVCLAASLWLPAGAFGAISGLGPQPGPSAPVLPAPGSEPGVAASPTVPVAGTVRSGAAPQAGVPVRFWAAQGGAPVEAATDGQGAYRFELGDGSWRGAACGSPWGYEPLFWEVTVSAGRVARFQEVSARAPVILAASPSDVWSLGQTITLTGSGFGCSGRVVIEFPQHRQVVVVAFRERGDDRLVFDLPSPVYEKPPEPAPGTSYLEGSLTYWHGALGSQPLWFRYAAPQATGGTILSPSVTPLRTERPATGILVFPSR